jgi:hypothetical protein
MGTYMSNEQMCFGFSDSSLLDREHKTCIYCNESKVIDEFPRHIHYKDNLDSRCRECIKKHTKVRNELRKTAPEKPETCECCGKIPDKWVLDHNHTDDSFRGWLCDQCNTGIGKLGDNIEGIVNALNYLLSRNK